MSSKRSTTVTQMAKQMARRDGSTAISPGRMKTTSSGKKAPVVPQTRRERLESLKAKAAQPRGISYYLDKISGGAWATIITATLFVLVIALVAILSNRTPGAGNGANVGQINSNVQALAVGAKAPPIDALQQPDNTTFDPSTVIGKKPVLLELFAPWCPHCQAMTQVLNQLQSDVGSKAQIFSVSATPYNHNYETTGDTSPISMSDMQWFHDTYHVIYPELFDPSLKTVNTYGLFNGGYPTFYMINSQGVVTYAASGEVSSDTLKNAITQAGG
jgi:thiol-disulfide isomerase/thioredoxin